MSSTMPSKCIIYFYGNLVRPTTVLEIEIVESIFLGGSSSNHFYVNDITEYASEVRCLYGNLVRPTTEYSRLE